MPTNLRILGIDPGTRQLGAAVLAGSELHYYGVRAVRKHRSAQAQLDEIRRLVRRLVDEYRPDVLAIERVIVLQKSAGFLAVVAEEIKATATQARLTVREYSPAAVREHLCQSGRPTKREAAKQIAARYLELARYHDGRTVWEAQYYSHMFDAIAVALVCLADLDASSQQSRASQSST